MPLLLWILNQFLEEVVWGKGSTARCLRMREWVRHRLCQKYISKLQRARVDMIRGNWQVLRYWCCKYSLQAQQSQGQDMEGRREGWESRTENFFVTTLKKSSLCQSWECLPSSVWHWRKGRRKTFTKEELSNGLRQSGQSVTHVPTVACGPFLSGRYGCYIFLKTKIK